MKYKEFHQFFITHEDLPDTELADKLITEFVGVSFAEALDLIQTTRNAIKFSDNPVERKQK